MKATKDKGPKVAKATKEKKGGKKKPMAPAKSKVRKMKAY